MDRVIPIPSDQEQEGLMYDLDRARSEGLYEHMTIRALPYGGSHSYEVNMTDELFDALMNAMDLSVNQEPGTTSYSLTMVYSYGYGRPEPEEAAI
jgi:hypothetical protein